MIVVETGSAPAAVAGESVVSRFMRPLLFARACFGPDDRAGFRVTIDGRGHAENVRDAHGESVPEPAATCLRVTFARVTFPPPRSGPVTVTVPDLPERTGGLRMEIVPVH